MKKVLGQWLPHINQADEAIRVEASGEDDDNMVNNDKEPAIDPSILFKIVGDDPAIHRKLLDTFVVLEAQVVDEIHAAFDAGSAKQVGELCHKLKSSSRTIGANALADLCEKLEQAGKADDWEQIKHIHQKLDELFSAVRVFIENK